MHCEKLHHSRVLKPKLSTHQAREIEKDLVENETLSGPMASRNVTGMCECMCASLFICDKGVSDVVRGDVCCKEFL